MKSFVVAARPHLLREHNAFGEGDVWNAFFCIQVDVVTDIGFVGKVAAIESIVCIRVEEIQIVRLLVSCSL